MPIDPTRTCSTVTEWIRKDSENKLYIADQSTPWEIRKHRRTFVSRPPVYYDTIWNELELLAPYYRQVHQETITDHLMAVTPSNYVTIQLLTFKTSATNSTPGILTYSQEYGLNWYYIYLNCTPGWFNPANIDWCLYCSQNTKNSYRERITEYSVIEGRDKILAPPNFDIWVICDIEDEEDIDVNDTTKIVSSSEDASQTTPTKKTANFILNSLFVKDETTNVWSLRSGYEVTVPLVSSVGFV